MRVVCRVSVQVRGSTAGPFEIQSDSSECSIVMANQPSQVTFVFVSVFCTDSLISFLQWSDSEVSILIHDTFRGIGEERELLHVGWSRFMNCLQVAKEREKDY